MEIDCFRSKLQQLIPEHLHALPPRARPCPYNPCFTCERANLPALHWRDECPLTTSRPPPSSNRYPGSNNNQRPNNCFGSSRLPRAPVASSASSSRQQPNVQRNTPSFSSNNPPRIIRRQDEEQPSPPPHSDNPSDAIHSLLSGLSIDDQKQVLIDVAKGIVL